MKLNTPVKSQVTHEGGAAGGQTAYTELKRAVSTCMLWENTYYEPGNAIGLRIAELCKRVKPEQIAELAREARTNLKLRHVPLWLALQLVYLRHQGASSVIYDVIQRPDEMGELLAMYWQGKRKPIAAQLKKGLAKAFTKFSGFQLAKWNQDDAIKLRDVMLLVHPKPLAQYNQVQIVPALDKGNYKRGPVQRHINGQGEDWKRLLEGTLKTPDTWEVALSSGSDKLGTWTRLLNEKKLGDMALLMNLRNMLEARVDPDLISQAIIAKAGHSKALPFRYVKALQYAPQLLPALDIAMKASITGSLPGATALLVDVSGSMNDKLSGKSEMTRMQAASALAILLAGICERFRLWTFSDRLVEVPAAASLLLLDTIKRSQTNAGTRLAGSLKALDLQRNIINRVIVITDEQSQDGLYNAWAKHSYLINVASYQPGLDISHGWTRISGFSERVAEWIMMEEGINANAVVDSSVSYQG